MSFRREGPAGDLHQGATTPLNPECRNVRRVGIEVIALNIQNVSEAARVSTGTYKPETGASMPVLALIE